MKRILCLLVIIAVSAVQVNAGQLYTIRESGDVLVSIDTDTLAITEIGSIGVAFNFGGLAYDPGEDILYGIGGRPNESLFTLDRDTGAATTIGVHGIDDLFGLAFDSQNNVLYGTQLSGGSGIYTLNTSNGSAAYIGLMDHQIGGLAYNSSNDSLVGMQDGGGDLYEIDRSNAGQTLLYDGDWVNNSGLTFDAEKNLFWDIDQDGNLYSYDIANGYAPTQHLSGLGSHDGLAYVPEPATMMLLGLGGLLLRRKRRA